MVCLGFVSLTFSSTSVLLHMFSNVDSDMVTVLHWSHLLRLTGTVDFVFNCVCMDGCVGTVATGFKCRVFASGVMQENPLASDFTKLSYSPGEMTALSDGL